MQKHREVMKILDATAGSRSIWYQKECNDVVFFDKRIGTFNSQSGDKKHQDVRYYHINPNVIGIWQNLPFKINSFDMIVFDPPHLIVSRKSKLMGMSACYGYLYSDEWKKVLETAFKMLFLSLKENGTFILKWCENDENVEKVLSLIPYKPLFGSRTGQKNNTHWILFIKHREEKQLSDF